MLAEAASGNYKPLHISAHCPGCKHKEPWQRMKIPVLLAGSFIFFFIGGIVLSEGLPPKNNIIALVVGIALISFPFVLGFGNLFFRNNMNKASAELPDVSRPHFFLPGDDTALKQAIGHLNLQPDEQVEINFQDFPK